MCIGIGYKHTYCYNIIYNIEVILDPGVYQKEGSIATVLEELLVM